MRVLAVGALLVIVAACGGDDDGAAGTEEVADSAAVETTIPASGNAGATTSPDTGETNPGRTPDEGCAHVVGGSIEPGSDGFAVSATVLSADTGWEKYADAWEVRGPSGAVYGERVLAHPHETEQPFTRSLDGVAIPADVTEITIAARDSVVGFCGDVFVLAVPSS